MKQDNFVSFSNMLKKREKEAEPQVEVEPEIDYESLYAQAQNDKQQLQDQLLQLQNERQQLEQEKQHTQQQCAQLIAVLDTTVSEFRKELRSDVGSVFVAFLQTMVKDPRFHALALQDMLAQALIELGDKKNVVVHVPEDLLSTAQQFLSHKEDWKIVGQDISLGMEAQAGPVGWETQLHPVFEAFLAKIEIWLQEQK